MTGVLQPTFRVLGPLEVQVGERRRTIGSGRQRTLLALLLMRAGAAVPVERLIDELWGDDPPPSAGHALEAYVSRLRATLSALDVRIERRGAGYLLDLGRAQVDSAVFEELLAQAREASAEGDVAEAGARARVALALWRGNAYADVPFLRGTPSEAARLDELRLVAHEHEIDALLAAGENAQAIGELRALVETDPFREGCVSRLMVALYRSGRQADALAVYEIYRVRLSDDLGLEPSPALQQLSGQIVRHENHLLAPSSTPGPESRGGASRRRALLGAGIAAIVAIAVAVALALSLHTSAASGGPIRVGLVLPRPLTANVDAYVAPFWHGLQVAKRHDHLQTTTIVVPEVGPTQAQHRQLDRAIRSHHLDLVVVAGFGQSAQYLIEHSARFEDTHIAIVDYPPGSASELEGKENVTGLTFDGAQSGELAGYLAGLMEKRNPHATRRISAVGLAIRGLGPLPQSEALIDGYRRGARRALPAVRVRVDYSYDFKHQAACERKANAQIAAGSDIVYAASGTCGLGALDAADLGAVWGIGADVNRAGYNDHILASTIARFDRGVELAVDWYEQGSLPGAKALLIGLDDHAVDFTGLNRAVPRAMRSKVIELETQLRAERTAHA